MSQISPDLQQRVLTKLGLASRPNVDLEGLSQLYAAWCHHVPFDNVRKMIHVRSGDTGVLPGDTAEDFFNAWLRHGTGGTCWAGNGALCELLLSLGFAANRGLATMMVAPDLPPNHGTVIVSFGEKRYITDASILHQTPLELEEKAQAKHDGFDAQLSFRDGQWYIWWHPLHLDHKIDCRIDLLHVTAEEFHERHEQTRLWSPFNYELRVRKMIDGKAWGLATDTEVKVASDGTVQSRQITESAREVILREQFNYSDEIIRALPPDIATPPPPGSKKAAQQNTTTP